MEKGEALNKAFEMIAIGGDAKGCAYEALEAAEVGDFDKAERLLESAEGSLVAAHAIQTEFITLAARGEDIPLDMIFVHAQDHLMCAIEAESLITHLVAMEKRLWGLEHRGAGA